MIAMHANVLTHDHRSAIIEWHADRPTNPHLAVRAAEAMVPEQVYATGSAALAGRFVVEGLAPSHDYTCSVGEGATGNHELAFATWPAPPAPTPLLRYAVLSDAHIDAEAPDAYGRLLSRSADLFEQALRDIETQGIRLVLLAGDMVNRDAQADVDLLREAAGRFNGELLAVPGNAEHEIGGGGPAMSLLARWAPAGPARPGSAPWPFVAKRGPITLVGLDTGSGRLGDRQAALVRQQMETAGEGPLVVLTHRALIPHPRISDASQAVEDRQDAAALAGRSARDTIIYAGHKNSPRLLRAGLVAQVHLPQLPQYPCGYLLCELYPAELRHRFVPVRNVQLVADSRRASAATGHASMQPEYRLGLLSDRCHIIRLQAASAQACAAHPANPSA